jgi:hypothetical protein
VTVLLGVFGEHRKEVPICVVNANICNTSEFKSTKM